MAFGPEILVFARLDIPQVLIERLDKVGHEGRVALAWVLRTLSNHGGRPDGHQVEGLVSGHNSLFKHCLALFRRLLALGKGQLCLCFRRVRLRLLGGFFGLLDVFVCLAKHGLGIENGFLSRPDVMAVGVRVEQNEVLPGLVLGEHAFYRLTLPRVRPPWEPYACRSGFLVNTVGDTHDSGGFLPSQGRLFTPSELRLFEGPNVGCDLRDVHPRHGADSGGQHLIRHDVRARREKREDVDAEEVGGVDTQPVDVVLGRLAIWAKFGCRPMPLGAKARSVLLVELPCEVLIRIGCGIEDGLSVRGDLSKRFGTPVGGMVDLGEGCCGRMVPWDAESAPSVFQLRDLDGIALVHLDVARRVRQRIHPILGVEESRGDPFWNEVWVEVWVEPGRAPRVVVEVWERELPQHSTWDERGEAIRSEK